MDLLNAAANDPLADSLIAIKVHSSAYCLSEFGAPWGFRVDGTQIAKFHLVLDGKCWLEPDGHEPVLLSDGDLVLLPRGTAHVMRDEPGSSVQWLDSIIDSPEAGARLSHGGDGARTRLLCGGFGLTDAAPVPLLSRLPPVVHLDFASVGAWTEPLVALVRQEADRAAPGAQAIFAKLADVLLSQAIRAWLSGEPLVADRDSRVDQAVRLLVRSPGRPWSLDMLAREVGMSRTQLATRFRAATGDSPMRHLARIRLDQAAGYLASADLSIAAIARRTGYASGAALSKAFKREFGVSPGTYRNADTVPARVRQLDNARPTAK